MAYGKATENTNSYKPDIESTANESDNGGYVENIELMQKIEFYKREIQVEELQSQLSLEEQSLELKEKQYKEDMNKLFQLQSGRHKIIYDDDQLESIFDNTKDSDMYDNPYATGSDRYTLKGNPNRRIAIVEENLEDVGIDIDNLKTKTRNTEEEIENRRIKIGKLKDTLNTERDRLQDAEKMMLTGGMLNENR